MWRQLIATRGKFDLTDCRSNRPIEFAKDESANKDGYRADASLTTRDDSIAESHDRRTRRKPAGSRLTSRFTRGKNSLASKDAIPKRSFSA
jgi:hypothetical protein